MMTSLINYDARVGKQKNTVSDRTLAKLLQNRNKAEMLLKQTLRNQFKINPDARNEILHSVHQYTTRAPLSAVVWNKYSAKKCIEDAIFLDQQFDPYKVKEAFRLVEEMLVTLIQLPWHKEFRKIFTYSGQFRQHVSGPLNDIEEVLKSAGFQPSSEFPMHLILPSVRMPQVDDGECVASTLFDCLIAQAICCEIIDVFEDCCRRIKMTAMDNYCDYINSYPWIKRYYSMREDHNFDVALDNLDDLFCDFANHLSKLDLKILGERNMEAMDQVDNGIHSSQQMKSTQQQQKMRDYSYQQQVDDKHSLPSLPDDLLRLPANYTSDNLRPAKRLTMAKNHQPHHNQGQKTSPVHLNGYGNELIVQNNAQKQDLIITSKINFQRNNSQSSSINSTNTPNYHNHQLIEVDVPHNDRQLLLPKHDRKPAMLYHKNLMHVQPNSLTNSKKSIGTNYESDQYNNTNNIIKPLDDYHNNGPRSPMNVNNLGSSSSSSALANNRRYFQDSDSYHYHNNHQDHQQARYIPNYQSHHKKYDSRDLNILSGPTGDNNGLWICDECSYGNANFSLQCQKCRRGK